jgi:hypothetical protein
MTLDRITSGKATTLFSTSTTNQPALIVSALNGGEVLFGAAGDRRLLSISRDGGAPIALASNVEIYGVSARGGVGFAILREKLQWEIARVGPSKAVEVAVLPAMTAPLFGALATDGTFAYFIDPYANALKKIEPKPGATPVKVVDVQLARQLLAVDDACVYYAAAGNALMRAPK